mgnify:FL=1
MKSTSHEEHKRHAFDSYCKKVLKNEAINIQRQLKRQRELEISFSNLSEQDMKQLSVTDDYMIDKDLFRVLEYDVGIKDELLGEALKNLSDEKRDIILLSYFLGMTDKEIAEVLQLVRSTVQYKRTTALKELKRRLEEKDNDEK